METEAWGDKVTPLSHTSFSVSSHRLPFSAQFISLGITHIFLAKILS